MALPQGVGTGSGHVGSRYLKMNQRTGVRITSVAPLGAANEKVNAGDILLSVDGYAPEAPTWMGGARLVTH